MRKMTDVDVQFVIDLLSAWSHRRLTWVAVQAAVSKGLLNGQRAWTRQSLEANSKIQEAWAAAKTRLSEGAPPLTKGDPAASEVSRLRAELDELQVKYDALMIRHKTLAYNATFLPGGASLLLDPLPDNTPAKKSKRSKSRSRHK